MKIALVDIGTNSTKCVIYLIEKGQLKHLSSQTIYNRIGEKLSQNKIISNQKIFELINILSSFKKEIEKHQVNEIICIATWALRFALNGSNIVKDIESNIGLKTIILDEYKENLYTFYALNFFENFFKYKAALNIGGGSIEISIGKEQLEKTITLNLGGVILKEKFFNDPYLPNFVKIKHCTDYVWKILKDENIKLQIPPNIQVIGIGGTFSSIFDISLKLKIDTQEIAQNLIKLPPESLSSFFNKISKWGVQHLQQEFGLPEKRADIFLPSLVVLKSLCDILELPEIYVSTLSIREGYIYYHYLYKNSMK